MTTDNRTNEPTEVAQLMAERDAGKQAEADRAYLYQLGLKLGAERDAALAAIGSVRSIHTPTFPGYGPKSCVHDGRAWPCPTIQALDVAPEPEVKELPIHRTEAGWPNCATCDGGGCYDCTDPA